MTASVAFAGESSALPPNETRAFREGANHHAGDDGLGGARTDDERTRMHAHLAYIRAELGRRPATRPELAKRRAELLGYLDEYIAKGTTPANTHLPWRSPVFIDDAGRICAVGYLIERSSGRAIAESIAASHRYDYLEDIARAMPEVASWIASSGLSLDELASIQPGYVAAIDTWRSWDFVAAPVKDGPFHEKNDEGETTGAFTKGQMSGAWTRTNAKGVVIGRGTFARGSAAYKSFYADGKTLAEGPFVESRPHGSWRFFHPSGNLAAEGTFERGVRAGAWRFYYDTKDKTVISRGAFRRGSVSGTWEHFDTSGQLLATSTNATPASWNARGEGHLLSVLPGKDGVRHVVHQGSLVGDYRRLDAFFLDDERLYVSSGLGGLHVHDAEGRALTRRGKTWEAASCGWTGTKRASARAGDITTLHGLLDITDEEKCGTPKAVASSRAATIDRALATLRVVRAPSAEFVKKLALGERTIDDAPSEPEADVDPLVRDLDAQLGVNGPGYADDQAKILAAHMSWYVEWPHVDGRFLAVFETLAGYHRE